MNHKLREYEIIKTDFIESCWREPEEDILTWKELALYFAGVFVIGAVLGGIVIAYGQFLRGLL